MEVGYVLDFPGQLWLARSAGPQKQHAYRPYHGNRGKSARRTGGPGARALPHTLHFTASPLTFAEERAPQAPARLHLSQAAEHVHTPTPSKSSRRAGPQLSTPTVKPSECPHREQSRAMTSYSTMAFFILSTSKIILMRFCTGLGSLDLVPGFTVSFLTASSSCRQKDSQSETQLSNPKWWWGLGCR